MNVEAESHRWVLGEARPHLSPLSTSAELGLRLPEVRAVALSSSCASGTSRGSREPAVSRADVTRASLSLSSKLLSVVHSPWVAAFLASMLCPFLAEYEAHKRPTAVAHKPEFLVSYAVAFLWSTL